jgi:O-methyltransferase domain/Dimerisation domain
MRLWPLLQLLWRARRTISRTDIFSLLSSIPRGNNRSKNPPPPILFQMATGYWVSQAIYVAAKLGIADLVVEEPKSPSELANATQSDPASLYRVLRALAGVGVFKQTRGSRFALGPLGGSLVTGVPGSLRAAIITVGEITYRAWSGLLDSVRTGSPAFDQVYGIGFFEHLRRNEDDAKAFDQGMSSLTELLSYAVLSAYDFSGIQHLMDVGGGHGTFLRNILEANPKMKGTVFDMPSTVEAVEDCARSNLDCERMSFSAGNFFVSVPEGADAHLLSNVIHDWDDDHASRILRNCRKAAARDGRLLLVEMVLPESGANCFSKLMDLNMLILTGGRERTRADFARLLHASGYHLERIIPTLAPQSLITAVPS